MFGKNIINSKINWIRSCYGYQNLYMCHLYVSSFTFELRTCTVVPEHAATRSSETQNDRWTTLPSKVPITVPVATLPTSKTVNSLQRMCKMSSKGVFHNLWIKWTNEQMQGPNQRCVCFAVCTPMPNPNYFLTLLCFPLALFNIPHDNVISRGGAQENRSAAFAESQGTDLTMMTS